MKLFLTEDRKRDLVSSVDKVMENQCLTIRQLASVLGKIIAALPVFPYGKLYYRAIEDCKIRALKASGGHYDRRCSITAAALEDLLFWKSAASSNGGEEIAPALATTVMFTDASLDMRGATCDGFNLSEQWQKCDLLCTGSNINALEILAIHKAVTKLKSYLKGKVVMVRSDNVTAVQYVNNMGGHGSVICNQLSRCLVMDARELGIRLIAAHIPGSENSEADFLSRLNSSKNTEWSFFKRVI